MERVELTAKEVLSIYTGVVFTERFEDILQAIDKIYGKRKDNTEYISCFAKFTKNINQNRPEIRDAILSLGKVVSDEDGVLVKDEYAEKFREKIGTNYIEFDKVNIDAEMDNLMI